MIQCAVDAAFAKMHMKKVQELKVQQVMREKLCVQEDANSEPGPSGLSLESDEIDYSSHVVSLAAILTDVKSHTHTHTHTPVLRPVCIDF